MTKAGDREVLAWQTPQTVTQLAKGARTVRLDTLAYLLDMVAMEAKQHVVLKGET